MPVSDELDPESMRLGYQTGSSRRLTFGRRLIYRIAVSISFLYLELIWRTARIQVIGENHLETLAKQGKKVIPVCWHQHLLLCSRYWVERRIPSLIPAFLISPSVDGEGPSMLANIYGAKVIRGSSTHTGTRAIRQLCSAIRKEQLSPLITPDGPRGPRFNFKPGALMVAQLSQAPIIPIAFAAHPAKIMSTWDKFVLVPPCARIVVFIGEPIEVPQKTDESQREILRQLTQQRMHAIFKQALLELQKKS